jgi:serine protease
MWSSHAVVPLILAGAVAAAQGLPLRVSGRAPSPTATGYAPGQVVVQFRAPADRDGVERTIRAAGGLQVRQSAFSPRFLVSLADDITVEEAVRRFSASPDVAFAEPNARYRVLQAGRGTLTPNDRFFPVQWNFRMIGAERTWGIQRGSSSVAVAVIDTGVAYENFGPFRKAPDWGDAVFLPGFDFVNGDDHPNDDQGHGTHVASTIGEATNNVEGVAGLAFGCRIMPVKALNAQGEGFLFDIAEAIDFAVGFSQGGGRPVKVINLSLGGGSSETLRQAIDRAVAAGVTVVAAAGNDGDGAVSFPASLPNVIAVGAVDGRKARAPYSNFGADLDVVAPGGDLDRDDDGDGVPDGVAQQTFDEVTAAREGRYDDFGYFLIQGTSQATPHVAALAALLVSQGITQPAAVKAAIESSAEDLGAPGRDDVFGHGLIRPAEALSGLGFNQR